MTIFLSPRTLPALLLALCLVAVPMSAFGGQTVDYSGNGGAIYGNGDAPPNWSNPTGDPNHNVLNINSGAVVGGDAY